MAKIMLVEDDNNLREIYGARLLAEGHDIVAAKDGEEALALAVQEKPDLIISDVMMPRISGFDMLDILRNAPETRYTKVIMMTALSQAEDKARADKLGADKYLVKSQVTLEDVANVVREVLDDGAAGVEAPPITTATADPVAATTPAPATTPVAAVPATPVTPAVPAPAPVAATPAATAGASQPVPAAPTPTANPVAATPSPVAAAPAPSPVVAPQSAIDPIPAPTIPEVAVAPAPDPVPATPPTVEAIANPVVEVPDDIDTDPVQAPPATVADEPAATPPAAPAADNLPPIVEPATVKVEMPKPLNDTTVSAPDSVDSILAQPVPAPSTPVQAPPATVAPAAPTTVINGATAPTVVTPTQPAPTPAPATTDDSTASTPSSVGGGKVIQPISDPNAKPDINQLLANEERRAAIPTPGATTVITPQPATPAQTDKDNELNNIAL